MKIPQGKIETTTPGGTAAVGGADVLQDRMPPIPDDKLTDAQKKAVAEMLAGPRGNVGAPFKVLLRSPEMMIRAQEIGEHLRFKTHLPTHINEFIILIAARQWTQQFEWDGHSQLALKAGVTPETIAAIAEGRRPSPMSADEEIAYDFCTELLRNQSVSDPTYARLLNRFDEQTVIDVTALCGYYSMLGMALNVARTPLPPGKTSPLVRFPH
jgi:4-carboxymuconolactone decarboxylase